MDSTACIALRKGGKVYKDVAIGTGPVYASLRAVEKIIKHPFSLDDYFIQAVTEDRDALGEVQVRVSDQSGTYRGRGVSTDIIEASILSTLAAVNKMLSEKVSSLSQGQSANQMSFENDMLYEHTDKSGE